MPRHSRQSDDAICKMREKTWRTTVCIALHCIALLQQLQLRTATSRSRPETLRETQAIPVMQKCYFRACRVAVVPGAGQRCGGGCVSLGLCLWRPRFPDGRCTASSCLGWPQLRAVRLHRCGARRSGNKPRGSWGVGGSLCALVDDVAPWSQDLVHFDDPGLEQSGPQLHLPTALYDLDW